MSSCVMTNLSRNRTGDGHVRQLYPTCIQSVSSYPYETSPLIPSLHYGTTERVSLYAPYTTLFLPLLQALFCSEVSNWLLQGYLHGIGALVSGHQPSPL